MAVPRGGASFDFGQLDRAGKEKVPLRAERPVFLSTTLVDAKKFKDIAELSNHVDERLRDASAADVSAPFLFVPVDAFPGAFQIAGGYTTNGGKLTVTFSVWRGKAQGEEIKVEGDAANLPELAKRIVAEARAAAKKLAK